MRGLCYAHNHARSLASSAVLLTRAVAVYIERRIDASEMQIAGARTSISARADREPLRGRNLMVNYELHEYLRRMSNPRAGGRPAKGCTRGNYKRQSADFFHRADNTPGVQEKRPRSARQKPAARRKARNYSRANRSRPTMPHEGLYARRRAIYSPVSRPPPPAPSLPPFVPPSTKLNQWHNSLAGCTVNRYRAAVKAAIY